jgi:hypothetical protein
MSYMKNGININVNHREVRRMVCCKRRLNNPHATSVGISGIANLVEPANNSTREVFAIQLKREYKNTSHIPCALELPVITKMQSLRECSFLQMGRTDMFVLHQSHSLAGRWRHRKSMIQS